jgi:Holliday junction resolvase RusA-like endonuclease
MSELHLTIPAIPPSAGHYNAYRVAGRSGGKQFVQCYPTADAKAWWEMVAAINAGRVIRGPSLELQYIVYMPDRRRRDVDNAAKQICDSLTRCGAIEDDSLITDIHGHKRFDPANPRTVIVVRTEQESML